MRTPEEINNIIEALVEDVWYNRRSLNPVKEQSELISGVVNNILKETWNEAIEEAAESVELFYRNPHDDEDFRQMVPYDVDKESILKLKK